MTDYPMRLHDELIDVIRRDPEFAAAWERGARIPELRPIARRLWEAGGRPGACCPEFPGGCFVGALCL